MVLGEGRGKGVSGNCSTSTRVFLQTKGQANFTGIATLLEDLKAWNLRAYVAVSAINMFGAAAPADLMSPDGKNVLRPGLNWNDAEVADRYLAVVASVGDLVKKIGVEAFYFGFGTDVELFLAENADYQKPFVQLVQASGEIARNYSGLPMLATGVSFSFDGLVETRGASFLSDLWQVCDQTPLTYVPIDMSTFDVRSPATVANDVPTMPALLPAGWPVVLERAGYPSGPPPPATPHDNSTQVDQYLFHHLLFSILETAGGQDTFRLISIDSLRDFPDQACQELEKQGIPPGFVEDLCTKGVYTAADDEKMAKDAVIDGIVEYLTPQAK